MLTTNRECLDRVGINLLHQYIIYILQISNDFKEISEKSNQILKIF